MATLTYDPTDYSEGEFSAEEQEALQIGEQLAQEEQQLLAGKFSDAAELEQAYIELQRKLGDPNAREPQYEEDTEEPLEEPTDFFDRLWEEAHTEYTEDTLQALREMPPEDLAQAYLEARHQAEQAQIPELSDEDVEGIQGSVGGPQAYQAMTAWAAENLSEQEINMFDTVMERGDPLAMFFATQALAARYNDSTGYDGTAVDWTCSYSTGRRLP